MGHTSKCQVSTVEQASNCRVATTQGKQGIWFSIFPDRENTGNFAVTRKILETQGKYILTDY